MNKIKLNIVKKNLSWEKNNKSEKTCDHKDCSKIGKYKAPKSRSNLKNYYFFCLDHVKLYNKSWNFYAGLSVDEIELSMRKDIVWDRPSWPLSGNPSQILKKINGFINNDYTLFENDYDLKNFNNNRIIEHNLTIEEQKSVEVLGIKRPLSIEKIKKIYKKLVKIFHPDVNKDKKDAERHFKEINQAYKILLKKFLRTNINKN